MTLTFDPGADALLELANQAEIEDDFALWLAVLFPDYCTSPLGDHHVAFWEWVWSVDRLARPKPWVSIWPRGGAKSTSAEMAAIALTARRRRRYGVYISGTQDQANDHLSNIGSMLESDRVATFYPDIGQRLVTRYGHSKGWKINRLRSSAGFSIDAVGLDTAARGLKLEDARPDFIVLDDVDSEEDSSETTEKKIRTLTQKLLPTGSGDCAVIAIQNLVIPQGIFARLGNVADKPADFLADRLVSGPLPAMRDLVYVEREGRFTITGGEPVWAGQGIEACQAFVDTWGLTAFLTEAQHEVKARPGGMYDHIVWKRCQPEDVPELVRVAVWVDPAVSDTDQSDSMGIQADGIGVDDVLYRLRSWEQRSSPLKALVKAIRWAIELGADHVGVETDQGGDTWESVYREALGVVREDLGEPGEPYSGPVPSFRWEKAGAGYGSKSHRSQQMLADYERPGRIVHVEGYHLVLEAALERFPLTKPHDLADAAFWAWRDLSPTFSGPVPGPVSMPGENYWGGAEGSTLGEPWSLDSGLGEGWSPTPY